jgi:PAS domain S-box-containing protein
MPQGSKILIVEDEMIISMEIKQKLTAMGYVVTGQAITGESAIQKSGDSQPDLVLMDIRLKGEMDGIAAAKRIIDLYDLPIIFLTAHSDKATLERAISVSPSGYLLKPFKERELMTNIEMSLHKHRVRQKLKEETTPIPISGIFKELSSLPVPIMAAGRSGTIEYGNQAALKLSGYTKEELVRITLQAIFGEQERARDADTSETISSRSRIIMPDQMAIRQKNGTNIPATISLGMVTGENEDEMKPFYMVSQSGIEEETDSHFGPGIIQHLMRITAALKLPAFVLDKRMILSGYNSLFTEMARKAGISQYMFNRPMFETPNFLLFADMQDLQEIFRSGDIGVKIKKFKTGEDISFIQFTRIPLKKDGVTTHIATVMLDVTNEKKALYQVERTKKVFSELFAALENLRALSREIKIPLQTMIKRMYEDSARSGEVEEDWGPRLLALLRELDLAWVQYSEVRDHMNGT